MNARQAEQAASAKALSVALQHPAVAADQQNICRIVQVCKAWRAAVTHSVACTTDINFKRRVPPAEVLSQAVAEHCISRLQAFTHWLPKYAGTVRSIAFDSGTASVNATETAPSSLQLQAHRVLASGLQCTASPAQPLQTAGCSTTSPANSTAVTSTSQPLQIQSFVCCGFYASPSVLSALPAATLTELRVKVAPNTMDLHEPLSRLSNLKSLRLESFDEKILPSGYLSAVSNLSRLTDLFLGQIQNKGNLHLLPRQLRKLDLFLDNDIGEEETVVMDLSHLSQLQHLIIDADALAAGSRLPQQLQVLDVCCWRNSAVTALDITSLQQLRQLKLSPSQDSAADLLTVKVLQQLESLKLGYVDCHPAESAAPAWPQLKQLVELDLDFSSTPVQMATIQRALCLLSNLKTLNWTGSLAPREVDDAAVVAAPCRALKHLTKLNHLHMCLYLWVHIPDEDLLHLAALTGLTDLSLSLGSIDADNGYTAAMLLELTGLQSLSLSHVHQVAVMPVVARLQGLTKLSLHGLSKNTQQQGLPHLTRLRNLRDLHGFRECGKRALEKFWRDLRA